jgi:hypothetical protein
VRFHIFTATSKKFRVYWDVAPCSHVEVDRRFIYAYWYNHQGDEYAVHTSETSVHFNVTKLHGATSQKTPSFELHLYHVRAKQLDKVLVVYLLAPAGQPNTVHMNECEDRVYSPPKTLSQTSLLKFLKIIRYVSLLDIPRY